MRQFIKLYFSYMKFALIGMAFSAFCFFLYAGLRANNDLLVGLVVVILLLEIVLVGISLFKREPYYLAFILNMLLKIRTAWKSRSPKKNTRGRVQATERVQHTKVDSQMEIIRQMQFNVVAEKIRPITKLYT